MDVGAVALEDPVRRHRDEDVEIARRRAAHPALALAGEPDAGAVLDPRRNVDRERLFAPHPALAAAALARLFDDPAGALAARAGALDREEALLRANPAAPVTGRALYRLGAGLGAAAAALVAGNEVRHPDRRLLAAKALLERDFEIVAQIVAAARAPLAAAAAAHELAEHLVEDIGKSTRKAEIPGAAPAALLEGGMAEPVIGGALLIVLQNVIGLADVLEFLFGRLVARIAVRVTLHRQLAIGFFQIVGAGGFVDAENLVKILLGHDRGAFATGEGGAGRRLDRSISPRPKPPG